MGDVLLDHEGVPAAPGAGKSVLYVDSTSKKLSLISDAAGVIDTMDNLPNRSVASQNPFATDTYLVGSAISIPPGVLKVGALYRCTFDVSKTAAGTATPIVNVRFGTAGTTGDAARLTFTFTAGTAAADVGMFDIYALFRTYGAAGVLQGRCRITHNLSITGLVNLVSPTLQVTSAAFDMTVASSIIGVSVNGGASAAWTVQMVESELANI